MCFVKWSSVIKLDLFRKQSFLIKLFRLRKAWVFFSAKVRFNLSGVSRWALQLPVQRPVRSPGAPIIKLYLCLVQDHLYCPSLLPKWFWNDHHSPEVLFTLAKFAAKMPLKWPWQPWRILYTLAKSAAKIPVRWPWQPCSFIYPAQVCCQNAPEMPMTALKFYLACPSLLPKCL